MVEQVKEDNEARQSDEEKSDTEDDVYTKSDVHLLNPKSTSKCGFQWVESPFRVFSYIFSVYICRNYRNLDLYKNWSISAD